jgi:hypothetical protein
MVFHIITLKHSLMQKSSDFCTEIKKELRPQFLITWAAAIFPGIHAAKALAIFI